MTPRSSMITQQDESRWLLPIFPFILAAASVFATVDTASPAAAAECQITDIMEGNTLGERTTWKGTTLNVPPLTTTVERDIFGALEPSPVLEVDPYLKSSRISWGNTESQLLATSETCGGQSLRKSALFNQAILRSIVKIQGKAQTQFMKAPPLPYNGKRQFIKIRTTVPEIEFYPRYQATTVFGPVLEIRKPDIPVDRTRSQTDTTQGSTVQFPSTPGNQPLFALKPFDTVPPLSINESLRMNLTTTHALQGGNCASGCP